MRSVAIHAALLAAALLAAFATWTAGDRPETERTLIEVWNRNPADLVAVTFRTDDRTVVAERRDGEGDGDVNGERDYIWGIETTRQRVPQRATTDSATADTAATPPPATREQVEQYPVGDEGPALFEGLARLRAIRSLGTIDDEGRTTYGFAETADTVTLRFANGETRTFTVGNEVVGGGDRYALDEAEGRVYVLPSELFRPLDYAGALRLTRVQRFAPDDVARVAVRAGARERVMRRQPTSTPPYSAWSPLDADRPDQTFANFMEQIDRLWVVRYYPDLDPATLQAIARVDWLDARGDTVGSLELFKATSADSTAWYLRTPATVVPGQVYGPVAERIEQDLDTVLRGEPEGRATD